MAFMCTVRHMEKARVHFYVLGSEIHLIPYLLADSSSNQVYEHPSSSWFSWSCFRALCLYHWPLFSCPGQNMALCLKDLTGHRKTRLEIVCGNWRKRQSCPSILVAVGFPDVCLLLLYICIFLSWSCLYGVFSSFLSWLRSCLSCFSLYLVKIVFLLLCLSFCFVQSYFCNSVFSVMLLSYSRTDYQSLPGYFNNIYWALCQALNGYH